MRSITGLLVIACTVWSCQNVKGTGIDLKVVFSGKSSVHQLHFDGFDPSGAPLGLAQVLPKSAGGTLGSPYVTDILVRDALAASTATVRVDGLDSAGTIVASGTASVQLVSGKLVPLTVTLGTAAVCGDGVITASVETCDDANNKDADGCNSGCQTMAGYVCTGTPSVCSPTNCGNGKIDPDGIEVCDDGNVVDGDGCSHRCAIEGAFTCAGTPSCCKLCGDGKLQCDEQCDGGTTGSTGATGSSGASGSSGPIAANLNGKNCLSQGLLTGSGLKCAATCQLDTTSCGGPINSEASLKTAIQEAYNNSLNPGHDVVGIQASTIALSQSLMLNECGASACPAGAAPGLTLTSLGAVTLQHTGIFNASAGGPYAIMILSPNNSVTGLNIIDFATSIALQHDPNPVGNCVISGNLLVDTTTASATHVAVLSASNQILANDIVADSAAGNNAGVLIGGNATDTVVAMNVIAGFYNAGVAVQSNAGTNVTVDQNTFVQTGGTSVTFSNAVNACVRNNVLFGNSSSTGYNLSSTPTLTSNCSPASGSNLIFGYASASECVGGGCTTLCKNGGTRFALCLISKDPGLDMAICPGASLIDAGLSVGYDKDPDSPALYVGSAPDLGARERGASNTYGSAKTTCP